MPGARTVRAGLQRSCGVRPRGDPSANAMGDRTRRDWRPAAGSCKADGLSEDDPMADATPSPQRRQPARHGLCPVGLSHLGLPAGLHEGAVAYPGLRGGGAPGDLVGARRARRPRRARADAGSARGAALAADASDGGGDGRAHLGQLGDLCLGHRRGTRARHGARLLHQPAVQRLSRRGAAGRAAEPAAAGGHRARGGGGRRADGRGGAAAHRGHLADADLGLLRLSQEVAADRAEPGVPARGAASAAAGARRADLGGRVGAGAFPARKPPRSGASPSARASSRRCR